MTQRPKAAFNNATTITHTMGEVRSKALSDEIDLVADLDAMKKKYPSLYESGFGKRDPAILAHIEMILG